MEPYQSSCIEIRAADDGWRGSVRILFHCFSTLLCAT